MNFGMGVSLGKDGKVSITQEQYMLEVLLIWPQTIVFQNTTKTLELEGVQLFRTRVPPYLDTRAPADSRVL